MPRTEFGENLPLTRGMIVTVLHRKEGKPEVTYSGVFTDVSAGEWYTDGVEWAASHGIVLGCGNGRFGPKDSVTREQIAAILFRFHFSLDRWGPVMYNGDGYYLHTMKGLRHEYISKSDLSFQRSRSIHDLCS